MFEDLAGSWRADHFEYINLKINFRHHPPLKKPQETNKKRSQRAGNFECMNFNLKSDDLDSNKSRLGEFMGGKENMVVEIIF